MKKFTVYTRIYVALGIVASYLAVGQLVPELAWAPGTKLVVLMLLGASCATLRLRLPRNLTGESPAWESEPSGVSVGIAFQFAALIELPAHYAALVAVAVVAGQWEFRKQFRTKLRGHLYELISSVVSLLVACYAYSSLREWGALVSPAPLIGATLVYVLAHIASQAAAIWSTGRAAERKARLAGLAATAPLYAPMAVAGALIQLMFHPAYRPTIVLAFPFVYLVYYAYELYVGRLRDEGRHSLEVAEMQRRVVQALALAIDAKDRITSRHLRRVEHYAIGVARRLGCTSAQIKALEVGALLHDIGKLAVPEHLLSKPGKLSRGEFNQIAIHPQVGAEILSAIDFPFPVAELVHTHHENWDGSGYPRGLKGQQIPLTARILSVVDCFDALISDRPYRPAFSVEKAIEMVASRRGTTFDPQVVDVLLDMLPQLQTELEDAVQEPRPRLSLRSPRAIEAVQTSLTAEELASEAMAAKGEQALPESQSLRKLLDNLGASLRLEEVMKVALWECGRVMPVDGCAVFLLEGPVLKSIYQTWPRLADGRPLEVPVGAGPTGWAAGRADTLLNGNPMAETGELGRVARGNQWRDALIGCLWKGGRVVGTLNLYSRSSRVYTEDHAHFLKAMTAHLGAALITAKNFEQTVHTTTDPLTEMPNTRGALELLQKAAAQSDAMFSALLIETDYSHVLNGKVKHPAEEALLVDIARAIQEHLRDSDFVGRIGDNQFLAVMYKMEARDLDHRILQLRKALAATRFHLPGGFPVTPTLSIGTAAFPAEAETAESLLCLANHRLLADQQERQLVEWDPTADLVTPNALMRVN